MERVGVAVLGGGITGLCAGHKVMTAAGADSVLVLEASDRAGGYVRTEHVEGYACDWGPNGFLDKEPLMLAWIDSLGIADELVQANEAAARRFLLKGGRLVKLLPPPRFLLSPMLSIAGRARLLCEPFVSPKADDTPESIWDFAARRIGREAADTLVSSMVTGVFGGDAKRLSLAHCFPRMAEMEREHGGLFKAMKAKRREGGGGPAGPGGTLTTFRGGIGRVAERAAALLGDRVRTGFDVAGLEEADAGFVIRSAAGESLQADKVIVALPVHRVAGLIAPLDAGLGSLLPTVDHAAITVVCTAYPREAVAHSMEGFGFLVPRSEGRRVLGCIWTSSVFPHSAPEGRVLLRSMFGGTLNPGALSLDDDALLGCLADEVHGVLGIRTEPEFVRIVRHGHGIPQYGLNHGEILAASERCEAAHPGLVFAGNGWRGVSLNDCVVSAERAVDAVLLGRGAAG